MKHLKQVIVMLLLYFSSLSFGQIDTEKYLITYVEKTILTEQGEKDLSQLPDHIKELVRKNSTEGEEKFLFINNNMSVYAPKNGVEPELIEFSLEREVTFHKSQTKYYKDVNKALLLIKRNQGEKDYLVKTDLNAMSWTMVNESKEINSLTCKKATGLDMQGNKIEAWYSDSILIDNGPSKYGGLPGLIVQLKSGLKSYQLKTIERTNTDKKINFPDTENAISIEEYYKIFYVDKGKITIKKIGG